MGYKKKIIILLTMFILFPKNINASGAEANIYKKSVTETDVISEKNKNPLSKEIIICSYGCTDENVGKNGSQCGNENESFSAILYNADTGIQNKWSIEMNIFLQPLKFNPGANPFDKYAQYKKDEDAPASVYNYKWTPIGSAVPVNGIYYENPSKKNDLNESWENTKAYTDLKDNFVCPQKMFYDHTIDTGTETEEHTSLFGKEKSKTYTIYKNNNMEICYEDNGGSCLTRNETNKTIFGKANKLNYSFADELGRALVDINNDIVYSDSDSFLLEYYVTEDDVCTAIRTYNGNQLVADLEKENYENYINESLKKYIQNSPNEKLYTYETLSKISTHLNNDLQSQFESLNTNYSTKIGESAEYYVKKCMPEMDNEYADSYKNEVTNGMTNKINKIAEEYIKKLDFDTLTCDELLGDIADMIGKAYFMLEIAAIVIAVVLTALDYAKVILSDGQDAMKKTNQKLVKRLIIVVVILLLPALINLILTVFNIQNFNSENPLCKINK